MPAFLCTHCGLQYPNADTPPAVCVLCQDDRHFVNPGGQAWTTIPAMRTSHFTAFRRQEPGLMGIGTMPVIGIGQRALLVRTPQGNILWDCVSFLDDATVALVNALGGIAAIAISSPHGYAAMVDWSHAFGTAPIYLHATDRKFVTRLDSAITFWEDEALELLPGVTLLRAGGPFLGGTMLHWAQGGGGLGALLTGTSLRVGPDRGIGFMRSVPNHQPLDAGSVRHMASVLADRPFHVIYGGWWDQVVPEGGRFVFAQSVERHLTALGAGSWQASPGPAEAIGETDEI